MGVGFSRVRLGVLAGVLLAGFVLPVCAQQMAANTDFQALSIEQLGEVEITSVSRRPELLAKASSLTRITTGAAADVKPAANPADRARENLVHVLLNHTDFVTVR